MTDSLERRPNCPPTSPSRLPSDPLPVLFCEANLDGQPVGIYALRKQLSVEFTARIPNGDHPEETVGTAATEFIVVNSRNLRLLSLGGTALAKHALHQSLFEYARRNGLDVLPSDRINEETKQWLIDNKLPDHSTPDI